jgi:hypothetical protein
MAQRVNITRFGISGRVYTFQYVESASPHFGGLNTQVTRLPGISGGYDEFGFGRTPGATGDIPVTFTLLAPHRSELTALQDAVMAMQDWGIQPLYMQPEDTTLAERFTWARVNNIEMSESAKEGTEYLQQVTVHFQVSDPFWYGIGNCAGLLIGVDFLLGTSYFAGTPAVAATGNLTTATLTPSGNQWTHLLMSITPNAAKSVTNPVIRRIRNGDIADQVSYVGTLNAGDNLTIDPRAQKVTLNGADARSNFDALNPDWMRLLPEANAINVIFANSSDDAAVELRYLDRYK